jgi:hypothetical protein
MKAIYDNLTGEILKIYKGNHPDLQLKLNQEHIDVADNVTDITSRVDITNPFSPVVIDKTASPGVIDKQVIIADNVDKATITGVPNNTFIRVHDGDSEQSVTSDQDNDTIELKFDMPGEYTCILSHGLYLVQTWNLTAT